jgi:hypothetical protein
MNLIQYAFLGESARNSLRNWPWGWRFYSFRQGKWKDLDHVAWCDEIVYRGLPKALVTSEWFNIYPRGPIPQAHSTRKKADDIAGVDRIVVMRIDTCNGVSTADFEGLWV